MRLAKLRNYDPDHNESIRPRIAALLHQGENRSKVATWLLLKIFCD